MLENAGRSTHFYLTYEEVNKTDSLQPSGCNGPLVYINLRCVGQFVCYSCSPLSADQSWKVRYQAKSHIPEKVGIICLWLNSRQMVPEMPK